jgi:hypothetical protein
MRLPCKRKATSSREGWLRQVNVATQEKGDFVARKLASPRESWLSAETILILSTVFARYTHDLRQ